MKKLLGFASLLFIALLTACNADNLDEIVEAGKAVQVTDDSDVPVLLSISPASISTTEVTRAPLATQSGNFSTPDGQYLGVFALAQTNTPAGGQTGPVATNDIKWDGTVRYARLMWNVPTQAITANNMTSLIFMDASTLNNDTPSASLYNYPRNNWYNYYFYGYYPRVNDANVSVSNNVVTVDYTLNGSQDIIAGVATPVAGKENDGFCRSYFENNPGIASPKLTLEKHRLTQLRFFVCSKSYVDPTTTFQVKDITLKDVPTDWTLTVADKATPGNVGTLTSRSAAKADFPVREMTVDASNNMVSASDNAVYVGGTPTDLTTAKHCAGYAMIPPSAIIYKANNTLQRGFSPNYNISLTIQLNDEEETLTRTISEPAGGFLANKVYNIIITIDPSAIGGGGELPDDPRAVDLGLSVKWAAMNIGASTETDKGLMFTWGGTTGYAFNSTAYDFLKANDPLWNKKSKKWRRYSSAPATLESTDDAAAQDGDWGGEWRMPTQTEYSELITNTTKTWQTNYKGSGVNGYLFTSTKAGYTDKSIFLPAAGYRDDEDGNNTTDGYYWSSTLNSSSSNYGNCLIFKSTPSVSMSRQYRYFGLSIRAVKPKN